MSAPAGAVGTAAPERVMKAAAATSTASLRLKKLRRRLAHRRKAQTVEMKKRARSYEREYRSEERRNASLRKVAKAHGNIYQEAEPRIALVIRIRGINDMPPKPKKILQLLRLRQIFSGVFVRLNRSMELMLQRVAPYITWGYPSLSTVRQLVLKRGRCKVNGQRLPMDNANVQKVLGKFGMMCVSDLVHEIWTCGPRFSQASNFLWPFRLSCPSGGMRMKRKHYVEGGDFGNREKLINKMARCMN